jgi:hypothetical protein
MPLPRPGDYTFWTEVGQGYRVLDKNRLDFRVGEEQQQQRPHRRIPGWLVNKVYQVGTLRHTGDGLTLSFHNPAMPVTLQRLRELRVDGETIAPAQIELVSGGVSRRASTITPQAPLEVPSHRRLTVVVERHPLTPGPHRLEITVEFFGLGEIAVQIRDRLI